MIVRQIMKVKYAEVVMSSHLLEHPLPMLPVTNQISYQKNMKLVKGQKWKKLNPPDSCREHQNCNNVELDEDIFFVVTKNFPNIQEERFT